MRKSLLSSIINKQDKLIQQEKNLKIGAAILTVSIGIFIICLEGALTYLMTKK